MRRQIKVKKQPLYTGVFARLIALVLLPAMLAALFFFVRMNMDGRSHLVANNQQVARQIAEAFQTNRLRIESIGAKLATDSTLIGFLYRPYQPGKDYLEYASLVSPRVLHNFSDPMNAKIFVFPANDTIPNGFGAFYHQSYLAEDPLFSGFLQDESQIGQWYNFPVSLWYNDFHPFNHQEDSLLYIRRMQSVERRPVGYVAILVPLREVIGALDGNAYVRAGDALCMNLTGEVIDAQLLLRPQQDLPYETPRHNLASMWTLNPVPLRLLVITSGYSGPNALFLPGIAFALVGLLSCIFFRYLSRLLGDIQNLIRQARCAIVGDRNFRLQSPKDPNLNVIATSINYLLERIGLLWEESLHQERMLHDAQLTALQHQINPHFVFNALEALAGHMEIKGMPEESDALTDFARVFRYNLNANCETATLASEIANVNHYLNVRRLTAPNIRLSVAIDPALLDTPIMRFVLQPLVENSVSHGLTTSEQPLTIVIRAERTQPDGMEVSVADNGRGIAVAQVEELRAFFRRPLEEQSGMESVGLRNLNARLCLQYGTGIQIESREGEGTKISFHAPLAAAQ